MAGPGRPKKEVFGADWWQEPVDLKSTQEIKESEALKPDAQTQAEATEALKKLTDAGSTFDLQQISDWNYLNDIFGAKYDTYSSLPYLKKVRTHMLKVGYPETPLLNTLIFLSTIMRRLQIVYQHHHVLMAKQHNPRPEDLQLLKQIQEIGRLIGDLQKAMDLAMLRKKETEDVFSIHEKMMKLAEQEVAEHIGEFTFRCHGCGTVMNTQGLEHWAIRTSKALDGSPVYHVFSPYLWHCVEKGLMPLYLAAFALDTSIEGVLLTAKTRKETWHPTMSQKELEEQEHLLAELRKPYEKSVERVQRDKFSDA